MAPASSKCVEPNAAGAPQGIVYSQACIVACRGGKFDARAFLGKPKEVKTKKDASSHPSRGEEDPLQAWKAKVKIIDLLNAHPASLTIGTLQFVEDQIVGVTTPAPSDEKWNETYVYVKKLPKYWRGAWLLENFGPTWGWDKATFDKIDEADGQAINYLFDFVCAVHPNTHLPRECIIKADCGVIFLARARLFPNRLTKQWADSILDLSTYTLRWTEYGVYSITKREEQFLVKHIDGPEKVWDRRFQLDNSVRLIGNCWDMLAKVERGDKDQLLCKCFKVPNEGPHHPAIVNTKGLEFNKFAKNIKEGAVDSAAAASGSKDQGGKDLEKLSMEEIMEESAKKRRKLAAKAKAKGLSKKARQTLVGNLAF